MVAALQPYSILLKFLGRRKEDNDLWNDFRVWIEPDTTPDRAPIYTPIEPQASRSDSI